ncbi:hypothetical protein BP5796_13241 [Coleophoma crateriformis]|uniref:NACHT domain-containing protein n=1 Tax=Coleophoma crateriformis TaxID=565419 RepID=A0A3D8Q377_9HELO|nr:hypothetical protein BP5796_13241 [Coleophoma crateriformis]
MASLYLSNEAALQTYNATLSPDEKFRFLATNVNDVLLDVQNLEKRQAMFSKTRRISRRIDPFIKFLQRYAAAVDTLVQFDPQPSALAWGCLRFLIEMASLFAKHFAKIVGMMEQIGDMLPLYERYTQMFADSAPFREALANMYFDVVLFLCRARAIFKSKALKTIIKSAWKPFESEFEDVISALARHAKIMEVETTFAHRQTIHVDRQRRVMKWLNPVDVEADFRRERNRRAEGTCIWFKKNSEYECWKGTESPDSILWITGRPGSGKSVLSTSIIEHLQQDREERKDCEVTYFFFDKNNERTSTSLSLVVSLIGQLVDRLSIIPSNLLSAYQVATKFGHLQLSESDKPTEMFISLVKDIPVTYVVLDGLDECSDLHKTLDFISSIIREAPNIHLLCLSRETEALKKILGRYSKLKLDPGCTQGDIDTFLLDEIRALSESLGRDLHAMLFDQLSRDANGNFLWAYLMIQNLKAAPSLYELKAMMEQVPRGLVEMYRSILSDLENETERTQNFMKKIFIWICCSVNPLSWPELQIALAIDPKDEEFDDSKTPFKSVVLRLCSPLIEYSAEEDVFRPIHLSLCEFFLDPNLNAPKDEQSPSFARKFYPSKKEAHTLITISCLTYLSLPSIADVVTHDKISCPFVGYATSNWCYHLLQSEPSPDLQEQLIRFLSSTNRRRIWQTRWLLMDMTSYPLPRLMRFQRSIQLWIKDAKFSSDFTFDALEDMFGVLLSLDTSAPNYLETPTSNSQIHIGHFEKMMVVRDLARGYTTTGRLDDARRWLEDTLAKQEENIGKDSLESIWILNSLGMIYDQLKLFSLSTETQLHALHIQKEKLAAGHLDIVWTSNELGRVYRHLSKLEEAETAHLQALQILEISLPKDDPHIIWTVNCLARTYRLRGKVDDALALHQRACTSQTQTLGPNHPHTLWTMSDISRCLRDQGQIQEAYEEQLKVLHGREKTLGTRHADTYWSMNDVGLLLTQLKRKREAKLYHEKAWAGQKELLGEGDAMTIWTRDLLISFDAATKL